jgi:hypothetical protein
MTQPLVSLRQMVEFQKFRVVQSCTELYRVVQSCTELYRVVHSCTELYRVVQSCTESYRVVQSHTELYRVGACRNSFLVFVSDRINLDSLKISK